MRLPGLPSRALVHEPENEGIRRECGEVGGVVEAELSHAAGRKWQNSEKFRNFL